MRVCVWAAHLWAGRPQKLRKSSDVGHVEGGEKLKERGEAGVGPVVGGTENSKPAAVAMGSHLEAGPSYGKGGSLVQHTDADDDSDDEFCIAE